MIKKSVLLIISTAILVLAAVFIYINNDLPVKRTFVSTPVEVVDATGEKAEKDLDLVFEQEEAVDNFDDVVE